MTLVRVLPNVTGLDKEFDYLVPERFADRVGPGTLVRVPLHGRRVGGWVLEVDPPDPVVPTEGLKEITGVTGIGPSAELLSLAEWAADEWGGRRRHFLVAGSPDRAVTALPPMRRSGLAPEPRSPAATRILNAARDEPGAGVPDQTAPSRDAGGVAEPHAHRDSAAGRRHHLGRERDESDRADGTSESGRSDGQDDGEGPGVDGGVLRLPPSADLLPSVMSAVALGPTLVVVPEQDAARLVAARLRRAGLTVALVPDEWAAAAGGVDVVVGTRTAAWAPCPDLAAAVVLDEHDEALQDEGSPTWHARDVVVERCRRSGVPWLLVSPVPTLHALALAQVVHPPADRERRGWPIVEVLDRTGELPWKRSLVTSALIAHLRDPERRVVCVSNTTGRARLLACRSCRALARCERCDAAVAMDDEGRLRCGRCELVRPVACLECRANSFANLRPGVTRLREELEAAAGRTAALVTGDSGSLPVGDDGAVPGVLVGTEAVLHRVDRADVVAFLDLDAELYAPRFRAAEQALVLLARAARLVGGRSGGGRLLLQTFSPGHEVIRAALLGDPDRVAVVEAERRQLLGLPPFGAVAEVSGTGAAEFIASIDAAEGISIGGGPDRWLLRADTRSRLGRALRGGTRPPGSRLRIAVDPPRI